MYYNTLVTKYWRLLEFCARVRQSLCLNTCNSEQQSNQTAHVVFRIPEALDVLHTTFISVEGRLL